MSAATILLLRSRKIIKGLKEAGAVSPETAIPYEEIGLKFTSSSGIYIESLVKKGKIKKTEDGRYYI